MTRVTSKINGLSCQKCKAQFHPPVIDLDMASRNWILYRETTGIWKVIKMCILRTFRNNSKHSEITIDKNIPFQFLAYVLTPCCCNEPSLTCSFHGANGLREFILPPLLSCASSVSGCGLTHPPLYSNLESPPLASDWYFFPFIYS